MPLEYAGYQPTSQIDWGALSGKIADAITKIGEDRNAKRAEIDQKTTDTESLIANSDLSQQDTSLNNKLLKTAQSTRDQIAKWNKQLKNRQLSPDEYKKKLANIQESWNILSNSVKTFDQKAEEFMKRQQIGENGRTQGSTYEAFLNSRYGRQADLRNKEILPDDNGHFIWATYDDNGNMIGSDGDIRAINRVENLYDNDFDVNSTVKQYVDNFPSYVTWTATGKNGEITIDDIRQNKAFDQTKASVMATLTNNPRKTLAVIADNADIAPAFYESDAEYKQQKKKLEDEARTVNSYLSDKSKVGSDGLTDDQRNKIELSLVKNVMGPDGVMNPELTEKQKKYARDVVGAALEIQTLRKVTGTPQAYYKPESGGGAGKTEEKTDNTLYTKASQAFNLPFNKKAGSPERESARIESGRILTNLSGGKYTFAWGTGPDAGFLVITDPAYGTEVGRAKSLDEIAPYLFGTSEAQGSDKGMAEYKRQKSMGITTPQTRTTVTTSKAPR